MFINLIFNVVLLFISFLCILLIRVKLRNGSIMNTKLITIILIFCFLVFIFSAYQIVLLIK
ncbi:hypothetical protein HMPREF3051_00380 [Fusobacterium sp. HMSC064B11]|uniref:Uncharacterized protein n=2 Tax=Fusobacterium nucleatum subsp. polymorphum TaxID=76857 RepID=A5TXM2_FUSNP|nr:hypothetical protein RN93_03035 [Fusobacterium polymorphum]EDK89647.1 hypothetical protein FNP_1876 [Fusobacterium polymorphum ATCC 10953]OFO29470.1 hypothetical protein HMPREF3051_00380 [Fusobacterium sp. HMSC064B11]PHI14463.1 hypothetical protein CBG59_12895 [Fusobacterium polymorphum]PIM75261.1 hypothetical protein CTM65_04200 [Fusobacterium polymorphum]